MLSGLVSITFRNESADRIISIAREHKLAAIEWGGDQHVPHGDLETAHQVGQATRAAGLEVASYGSYWRAGEASDDPGLAPAKVIETAVALGAPSIRIWAGKQRADTATPEYREQVTADCREFAREAAKANLQVHLEYHDWTLTNEPDSAVRLLQDVDESNFFTLWQPPNDTSLEKCRESLLKVLPWVAHVHVFHWGKGWKDRFPLADGRERWRQYFSLLEGAPARQPRYALLEFVRDDDPAQLARDAETLHHWLQKSWGQPQG